MWYVSLLAIAMAIQANSLPATRCDDWHTLCPDYREYYNFSVEQKDQTTFDLRIPTDVPAVQELRPVRQQLQGIIDYMEVWTCTDKSRILLTSENGERHCIKF